MFLQIQRSVSCGFCCWTRWTWGPPMHRNTTAVLQWFNLSSWDFLTSNESKFKTTASPINSVSSPKPGTRTRHQTVYHTPKPQTAGSALGRSAPRWDTQHSSYAARIRSPRCLLGENSSLYHNMKKSRGQGGNGRLRRTEEAFVDIVSSATPRYVRHRGARYLSVSVSCAFAVSNPNNKSPIEAASSFFFFPFCPEQAHKASCTRAATVQDWEKHS